MNRWIVLALMFACGKKDEAVGGSGGGGSGGGTEPPKDKKAVPAEITAWMPKNASEAWQGAWNAQLSWSKGDTISTNTPIAIEITGNKAKAFDGATERELGFVLDSPCVARFDEAMKSGGTRFYSLHYLVQPDGKLLVGDGGAGYRKGKTAIVCAGSQDGIVIADDKGCKSWALKFRTEWESKPIECVWSTADGVDLLTIGKGDWATKVKAEGDLLMSDQFKEATKVATKAASYDEAKAVVSKEAKENDPGEQAKAAGGKVGDMKTVLGLTATFAADKKIHEGKPLELTAQFFSTSKSTSNGVTSYSFSLVDSKETSKFTVSCYSKTEVLDLKQYDKVTAKGTLKESFSRPSLEDCTLVKAK